VGAAQGEEGEKVFAPSKSSIINFVACRKKKPERKKAERERKLLTKQRKEKLSG
jgi:hypothetical protein